MRNPSLPLKIALVFSFSVAVSSSSNFFFSRPSFSLKSSSSSSAKSTAADLLSVLGSREQAASINRKRADDLRSCLRFLVPFCPNNNSIRRRVVIAGEEDGRRRWRKREENEMVWWPPEPVLELARLAVDSAGDPDAIYRALDPTVIPVPNVDGYREDKCELTRTPYGRRFINQELNSYLAFLFEMIVARGPSAGLNVSLSRYDLFHGHLFLATDSGRLGILFHAKEYPAYEKEVFPYNMGYCQRGSHVIYDDEMNLRNILWLAPLPCNVTKAWVAPGVLVILDANPEGVIYKDLVPEYVDLVRTIYEEDFGEVAVDVNYLNVGNAASEDKIFIT
ncbi:hypothetical protein MRB53_028044 [Persea americana]|uniref:Uncharacterized protein n=1 Tax=Persea americana TaxID=3435 RepID=A0ACC2KED2_PERAE|nr:hypothetical protein MRB53_028044 [Persea americana]|eukprot:TRINITY_DN5303_c0_g2_i1.p1 TRINITY_DN5303_c0_g2~~TRINITY_DN5303_c0_g2_i1.p1  ORF type:complete len:335 (+),score=61.32 TRINITY_DN5303_c0_g2_i1:219-1223(+)